MPVPNGPRELSHRECWGVVREVEWRGKWSEKRREDMSVLMRRAGSRGPWEVTKSGRGWMTLGLSFWL